MVIRGTDISMIRGDSETIRVSLVDADGNEGVFVDGDVLFFTIKENLRRDDFVLQKVIFDFDNNEAVIELEPMDTHNLRAKDDYVYDIQLTQRDGRITTIVPPSNFSLIGDVTRE